jgi:cell wall-associated NlpC family hydrolase
MLSPRRTSESTGPRLFPLARLAFSSWLLAGLWLNPAYADSADLLTQRVRNALRQHSVKRVALVLREETAGKADDETRADVAAFGKRLEEACRQLGVETVTAGVADELGDFSLTKLPDSGQVDKVLADSQADAVLAISWKPTKTGVALRLSLIDDDRLLWNNRTTLSRLSTKSQASTKAKTNASLAKSSGAFGKGTNSGSNLAGAGALGAGLSTSGGGLGTAGTGSSLAGSGAAGGTSNVEISATNARILEFTRSQIGKQVGNGECWTLAAEALRYAGAKPPVVYDFGDEVALDQLQPGDVLHFQTAVFVTPTYQLTMGAPDHVAVVGAARGTMLLIYHQNVNGDRRVQSATIDLATMTSGSLVGYRAQGRAAQNTAQTPAR